MTDITCPRCNREWPQTSEQGVSVDFYDECIVCKFTPSGSGTNSGTKDELDLIQLESIKRRSGQN